MSEVVIKKTVRLFFALWPQDEERAALAAWQVPLQKLCGGRVTAAGKLHGTLVFLGEVEQGHLEALQLAAREVGGDAMRIVFDIAHYWGHNHIVYAAPGSVPPGLMQLVGSLEQGLRHHHFSFDQRTFKPHVTLLRHAHWRDSPLPVMSPVVWNVHDFVLVQSVSEGQDMRYEVLARFPLNKV